MTQSEPDLILQMREKQAINQPKPKWNRNKTRNVNFTISPRHKDKETNLVEDTGEVQESSMENMEQGNARSSQ